MQAFIHGVSNLRPMPAAKPGSGGALFIGETASGDTVAVKILANPSLWRCHWFKREVRVLQKAAGRNGLVPVLWADLDAQIPYMVMPYFDGGAITSQAGVMSTAALRRAARQIADSLAVLHTNDICHGDLKPDNIFVSSTGSMRVGDPLGNGSGCTVSIGDWGGTPGYWAPEVAAGGPMSQAGDIFAFGATLHHLATGNRPTDDRTIDPRQVTDPLLRDLIGRCCQREVQNRPTIGNVIAMLAASAVAQRPAPNRTATAGGGGALAFLLLAFVGLAIASRK